MSEEVAELEQPETEEQIARGKDATWQAFTSRWKGETLVGMPCLLDLEAIRYRINTCMSSDPSKDDSHRHLLSPSGKNKRAIFPAQFHLVPSKSFIDALNVLVDTYLCDGARKWYAKAGKQMDEHFRNGGVSAKNFASMGISNKVGPLREFGVMYTANTVAPNLI